MSMQVAWLLEAEMFPDYCDSLIAQVEAQGHVIKRVPELNCGYSWDEVGSPYLRLFPADACVVFHGSMELAGRLSEEAPWTPTVYCNWPAFDCAKYYCELSAYLLNADYVMLPFGELLRRKQFLFDTLAIDSAVFVRPNSCRKSFTGQIARWQSFERDVELMGFYDVPPEAIVLVSSPKQIVSEWRFVVADQRVITGSLYKTRGTLDKQPDVDQEARSLAETIAAGGFQPDRAWVMDICRTDDGAYRLLEIGSFSFAELYACDMAAVVHAISGLAARDWEARLHEPLRQAGDVRPNADRSRLHQDKSACH